MENKVICNNVKPVRKFNLSKAVREIDNQKSIRVDTIDESDIYNLGVNNGLDKAISIINKNIKED